MTAIRSPVLRNLGYVPFVEQRLGVQTGNGTIFERERRARTQAPVARTVFSTSGNETTRTEWFRSFTEQKSCCCINHGVYRWAPEWLVGVIILRRFFGERLVSRSKLVKIALFAAVALRNRRVRPSLFWNLSPSRHKDVTFAG